MADFEPQETGEGAYEGDEFRDAGRDEQDAQTAADEARRQAEQDADAASKKKAEEAAEKAKAAAAKLIAEAARATTDMSPEDAMDGAKEVMDFLEGVNPEDPPSYAEAIKKLGPKGQKVMQAAADMSQNVNTEMAKQAAKAGRTEEYNQKVKDLRDAQADYFDKWSKDAMKGTTPPSEATTEAKKNMKKATDAMSEMNKSLTDPVKAMAEGGMDGADRQAAAKTAAQTVDPKNWTELLKVLGVLGGFVALAVTLKNLAEDETGCYLITLDSGGDSTKDKEQQINNPDKDHKSCCMCDGTYTTYKSCPKGADDNTKVSGGSSCVARYLPVCQSEQNPSCSGVVGSDGSVYYTWKTVTPLSILAGIPGAALNLAKDAADDAAGFWGKLIKPILIGLCVLIVVITICVIVVKVVHNKKKSK